MCLTVKVQKKSPKDQLDNLADPSKSPGPHWKFALCAKTVISLLVGLAPHTNAADQSSMSEALGSSLLMLSAAQQYSHGVGALTASHQQQQSPSATSLPSFASILHPPGISQPSYSNQSPNAKASVSTYLPPISSFQAPNFPPLADFLRRLSLLQYLPVFLEEGFNEVAVLCDITEDDFAAMDVKRGHRRVSGLAKQ